eukprot:TRINITY_DN3400_c0_g1_i6.p1 TRINITY_DN3400_c0_g1~~TRINITY_DN3400_c0_g1_i6.p1  ORF type:complete len:367 (+),score=129.23 TRINITY_DN3400_c0_g1_i6:1611-2711(+)
MRDKIRSTSAEVRRGLEKSFKEERAGGEDKRGLSKLRNRSVKDFYVTVPKPFKFSEREQSKGKAIRQKKLEEMIGEKQLEEENYLHHQFRANPIPLSTRLPLYDKLKKKDEARRDEIKKSSVAATKAREKPFSFYERDKDFYVKRVKVSEQNLPDEMKYHKPFKANPIPWAVTAKLFDEKMERANKERKERVKRRAQEMESKSKLPPRMEMHERAKKEGFVSKPKPPPTEFSFQPEITKHNPNFELQHRIFQKALEKHKKQKQSTVVVPFNFRESKRRADIMDYMDDENAPQIELKTKKAQAQGIASLKKPSVNPPSTAKMTAMANKRREELERKREHELLKDREDNARVDKLKKVMMCYDHSWDQ